MKVGDKVLHIYRQYGNQKEAILTIERETKNYWVIGKDLYDKKDGRCRGCDSYAYSAIKESTEKDIERVKFNNQKKRAYLEFQLYCKEKITENDYEKIVKMLEIIKGE